MMEIAARAGRGPRGDQVESHTGLPDSETSDRTIHDNPEIGGAVNVMTTANDETSLGCSLDAGLPFGGDAGGEHISENMHA